jgi:hypothetical protein
MGGTQSLPSKGRVTIPGSDTLRTQLPNISALSAIWADFLDMHIWSAIRSESYNAAQSAAAGRIGVDSGF